MKSETADSTSCAKPIDENDTDSDTEDEAQPSQGLSRFSSIMLVAALFISISLSAMSFSIISPFFSLATRKKGLSLAFIGVIFGEYGLILFVVCPFVARIAALVGNKKVILVALLTNGVSMIAFGFLEYFPGGIAFAVLCFVFRGTTSVGSAFFMVTSYAVLSYAFSEKVATISGVFGAALGMGFMIGPAIGGVLFDVGGFKTPFWTVGGLLLVVAFVAYVNTPEISGGEHEKPLSLIELLRLPVIWLLLFCYFSVGAFFGAFDSFLQSYLVHDYHYTPSFIGFLFFIPDLVYCFAAFGWGFLSEKMGWGLEVMLFGTILCSVSALFVDPPGFIFKTKLGLWLLVPDLVCIGIGCSAVATQIFALCLQQVYANGFQSNIATMNLVSGVINSAYFFGVFLGPTVSGVLYEPIGFDHVMMIFTGLFLLCAILLGIYILYTRCCKQKTETSNCDRELLP